MLNKVASRLLVLSIIACIAAVVVGNGFVYIMSFIALILTLLFWLLVLTLDPMWKLLAEKLKVTHKIQKGRFRTTILFAVPMFCVLVRAVNKNYWNDASVPITLVGNIGMLLFALLLTWNFMKCSKWITISAGIAVFVLFVALLSFVDSITSEPTETNEAASLRRLATLGYVDWVPSEAEKDIKKSGVTIYNSKLSFKGMNLYASRTLSEAHLIDMHGNIVHKWHGNLNEADRWQHAEMCDNGDILVLSDVYIMRLDWDSNVKWHRKLRAHHDVCVDQSGNIYTLTREEKLMFWRGIPLPILADYVAVLSTDGKLIEKIPLCHIVRRLIPFHKIIETYSGIVNYKIFKELLKRKINGDELFNKIECFDTLHSNSFEILNRNSNGFCKAGNWLISFRTLNTVVVIDPETQNIVWNWGLGEVQKQHHPTLLENENILIFDNGTDRGFTRIVELSPLTKEIAWEYKSDPPQKFFSPFRGANQRLPNGNTLITESDKGRVFEVTKLGKVVWEFYNPNINKEDEKREVIYRMSRICDFENTYLSDKKLAD